MNQTIPLEPEQAGERPIAAGDALMLLLWAIVIPSVVGVVFGAALITAMIATTPQLPFGQISNLLQGNFSFVVGATTAADAIVLWVIWRRAKRITAHPFERFFPRVRVSTLVWAALSAIALSAAFLALEYVLKNVYGIPVNSGQTEMAMMPKSLAQLAVVLGAFALFVPFFEEVLFRGFLFGWLKRVMPVWLAIIASAAVFALFHGLYLTRDAVSGLVGTGEIFAIGILLAWWAARTKSLWPSYVVHLVGNAAAFTLAFLLPGWP